ncbi:hypothetical protein CBS147326_2815 [Penicillium roqueforti]|nr:hypothetical protein CBS147326_2815 [Penicillium roqueforti]
MLSRQLLRFQALIGPTGSKRLEIPLTKSICAEAAGSGVRGGRFWPPWHHLSAHALLPQSHAPLECPLVMRTVTFLFSYVCLSSAPCACAPTRAFHLRIMTGI